MVFKTFLGFGRINPTIRPAPCPLGSNGPDTRCRQLCSQRSDAFNLGNSSFLAQLNECHYGLKYISEGAHFIFIDILEISLGFWLCDITR